MAPSASLGPPDVHRADRSAIARQSSGAVEWCGGTLIGVTAGNDAVGVLAQGAFTTVRVEPVFED
ncbi:hypothetical protein ACQPYE_21005 [Actinosynnema sp. CA-299493]